MGPSLARPSSDRRAALGVAHLLKQGCQLATFFGTLCGQIPRFLWIFDQVKQERAAARTPGFRSSAGTGKPSVLRHAVPRAEFPYVLAESGLRRRERAKCPPARRRNWNNSWHSSQIRHLDGNGGLPSRPLVR